MLKQLLQTPLLILHGSYMTGDAMTPNRSWRPASSRNREKHPAAEPAQASEIST